MLRSADEAIILAGGLGTRLRQAVPDLPKPLAPVGGRPFLAWLLDEYANAGFRRVVLATGYRSEQIELAIGRRWGRMEISYSREGSALGTGGAIRRALDRVQGGGVHVANGDTYLRYSPALLEAATHTSGGLLGAALAFVDDISRYGAVKVSQGRIVGFDEKSGRGPGLINAGSYFLTAEGCSRLPTLPSWSFEECVLRPWSLVGDVSAFEKTSGFIDIGVPEDYTRAQALFKN